MMPKPLRRTQKVERAGARQGVVKKQMDALKRILRSRVATVRLKRGFDKP